MNTRRGILSNLRTIDEPRREVIIPRGKPVELKGKKAELLEIADIAAQFSGGRLRLVFNEEDTSDAFTGSAARFLKLDGKRLGRDIELYGFMGDGPAGWEQTLVMFFEEILLQIKNELPESYVIAGRKLRALGESFYPVNMIEAWKQLF
jgi:hypothetical protein